MNITVVLLEIIPEDFLTPNIAGAHRASLFSV